MNNLLMTLDTDWAPDFVIDAVADQLVESQVRATWFITHISPAIERLRHYQGLFELGIHPNFLPASTHGRTPEDILRHCMTLVPEAESMRTHGLVQSTSLLEQIMSKTPIKADFSLYLPHVPYLRAFEYRKNKKTLWRVPYFWEDDFEIDRLSPCWHLSSILTPDNGLKIFNFHPIHIYLNTAEESAYQALKQRVPKLEEATSAEIHPLINHGEGPQTLFNELVTYLTEKQQSFLAHDIIQSLSEPDVKPIENL